MLQAPALLLVLSLPLTHQAIVYGPRDCTVCAGYGARISFAASILFSDDKTIDIPEDAEVELDCSTSSSAVQTVMVVWAWQQITTPNESPASLPPTTTPLSPATSTLSPDQPTDRGDVSIVSTDEDVSSKTTESSTSSFAVSETTTIFEETSSAFPSSESSTEKLSLILHLASRSTGSTVAEDHTEASTSSADVSPTSSTITTSTTVLHTGATEEATTSETSDETNYSSTAYSSPTTVSENSEGSSMQDYSETTSAIPAVSTVEPMILEDVSELVSSSSMEYTDLTDDSTLSTLSAKAETASTQVDLDSAWQRQGRDFSSSVPAITSTTAGTTIHTTGPPSDYDLEDCCTNQENTFTSQTADSYLTTEELILVSDSVGTTPDGMADASTSHSTSLSNSSDFTTLTALSTDLTDAVLSTTSTHELTQIAGSNHQRKKRDNQDDDANEQTLQNILKIWFENRTASYVMSRVYLKVQKESDSTRQAVFFSISDKQIEAPQSYAYECDSQKFKSEDNSVTLLLSDIRVVAFSNHECAAVKTYSCESKPTVENDPISAVFIAGIVLGCISIVGIIWLTFREVSGRGGQEDEDSTMVYVMTPCVYTAL